MKVLNGQKNVDINSSIFLCLFLRSSNQEIKEKYIGKYLPYTCSFDITIRTEE